MIKELIVNGSLIVSFMLLGGNIFKDKPFYLSSSKNIKILGGIFCGVLGFVLMLFSIKITDTIIVDMRNIALIIATSLGGATSLVICAFLIGSFRIIFFGINQASCISVIFQMVIHIITFLFILKVKKWSFQKRYLVMTLISIIISLFAFSILLGFNQFKAVSIPYVVIFLLTSFYCFYTLLYIQKSNEAFRKLKAEAKVDFLTGLSNVRQFDEYFNSQLIKIEKSNEKLSVLMIDIDHFKKVNDTYGHSNGDLVLQKLASLLKENIRQFDFVARKGGEEFVVLLLDCHYQRAIEIAERIRSNVENTSFAISEGREINITVSIGVSTYPDTTNNIHDLLQQADSELYCAKRAGRNQVSPTLGTY